MSPVFMITASDILTGIVLVVMLLFWLYYTLRMVIKQKLCSHTKYYENMACHGICEECGKDLGFIGNLRK